MYNAYIKPANTQKKRSNICIPDKLDMYRFYNCTGVYFKDRKRERESVKRLKSSNMRLLYVDRKKLILPRNFHVREEVKACTFVKNYIFFNTFERAYNGANKTQQTMLIHGKFILLSNFYFFSQMGVSD